MGSSAPKTESVVKGGKPVIVREYLSPQYLKELGGMAEYWQGRAQQAAATRQSNVNRYLNEYGVAPVYDPYKTTTGEVIQPYQAATPYDTTELVEAAQESKMFEPPKRGGKKKGQKTQRDVYGDALKITQSGIKNNPKFNSGQYS